MCVCVCVVACSGMIFKLTESKGTIAISALEYKGVMRCWWIILTNEAEVRLF